MGFACGSLLIFISVLPEIRFDLTSRISEILQPASGRQLFVF
jgi:hypothetical protein